MSIRLCRTMRWTSIRFLRLPVVSERRYSHRLSLITNRNISAGNMLIIRANLPPQRRFLCSSASYRVTSNIEHTFIRFCRCRDPNSVKRTVSDISWYPDGGKKLAVAFAIMQFQDWRMEKMSNVSYIWDVNNPNFPEQDLTPSSPLCCLEYNPKVHQSHPR